MQLNHLFDSCDEVSLVKKVLTEIIGYTTLLFMFLERGFTPKRWNKTYLVIILLRYDLPNGFTYLQLGRDFMHFFYLNICHFKTIHRTTFLSFLIFDFINKIEIFHFIHI